MEVQNSFIYSRNVHCIALICLVSYEHWAGCNFYEVWVFQMEDVYKDLQYNTVNAMIQGWTGEKTQEIQPDEMRGKLHSGSNN